MRTHADRPGIVARMRAWAGAFLQRASASEFYKWFHTIASAKAADVTQPAAQSTWVYAAATVVARTIKGLAPRLNRGGPEGAEMSSGPAAELIARPNKQQTWAALIERAVMHLIDGGELHLVFDGGDEAAQVRGWKPRSEGAEEPRSKSAPIRSLTLAGRSEMADWRDTSTGDLALWRWTPQGASGYRNLLPEAVATLTLPNPYDRVRGLAPVTAARLGINQDYRAALYNDSSLVNGANPGTVFSFDNATPEECAEYERRAKEKLQGPEKANGVWVLGGGAKVFHAGFNNVDLALYDGRRFNREEIFAAIGVPPVLGNVFDAAHYNVSDAAQRIFLFNTIIPLCEAIAGLFNARVLPLVEEGAHLTLDYTNHPVWQAMQREKTDSYVKLVGAGITRNEAVKLLALPIAENAEWGDTAFVPSTWSSAAEVAAGLGAPPESPAAEDAEKTAKETAPAASAMSGGAGYFAAAAGAAARREEERQTRAAMPAYARRFASWMRTYRNKLVTRMRKELGSAGARPVGMRVGKPASRDGLETRPTTEAGPHASDRVVLCAADPIKKIVLNITADVDALKKIVSQEDAKTTRRVLEQTIKALDPDIDGDGLERMVEKLAGGDFLKTVQRHKIARIASVERTLRYRIERTLREGYAKDETIDALTERVDKIAGGQQPRWWSLRIARSEAGQTVSMGRFIGARAAGVEGKYWITGANPRASHVTAGSAYGAASPIAIDTPFSVGGESLMFPRDPRGSAGQIVNCNCVMGNARLPAAA